MSLPIPAMGTPVMGYNSTAHRVMSIPELLELVFGHLDRQSNAANACVSKTWNHIALDTIWREVDDIRLLFSYLDTLIQPYPGSPLAFETRINPSAWSRFTSYARRVRRFQYNEIDNDPILSPPISNAAWEEISQTRTTLSVLPNLKEFTWRPGNRGNKQFAILFMNENIRSFTFEVDFDEIFTRPRFFQDIAARMPYLTQLDIRIDCPAREIETDFLELISGLPRLKKVVVPLFHITSKVMERLSKLRNLGTVQFEFYQRPKGLKEDLQNFDPALSEEAFPVLWDLSFSAHISQATSFLTTPMATSHLTSIYLHAMSLDGASSVHQFFTAVAENCPLTESLYMECLPGSTLNTQWNEQNQFEPLSLHALKPVFNCTKLKTFELMHPVPLTLTMEDLEELTAKCSLIEVLNLNTEPVLAVDIRSNLTLHAILPFARNCPNIRSLGLFIDATAADIPPLPEIQHCFTKLTELQVGVSSIVEVEPVATFLSNICPVGCTVVPGISWPYQDQDPVVNFETVVMMQNWCTLWKNVDVFLPLLTKTVMRERAIRKEIEDELEDLRTRNGILMGKAQLASSADKDESCVIV